MNIGTTNTAILTLSAILGLTIGTARASFCAEGECAYTRGNVSAQVCKMVKMADGWAYFDCGLQPIPDEIPDNRGFIPDVPENVITIIDTGEQP